MRPRFIVLIGPGSTCEVLLGTEDAHDALLAVAAFTSIVPSERCVLRVVGDHPQDPDRTVWTLRALEVRGTRWRVPIRALVADGSLGAPDQTFVVPPHDGHSAAPSFIGDPRR